jgi:hypothetical protein
MPERNGGQFRKAGPAGALATIRVGPALGVAGISITLVYISVIGDNPTRTNG